MAGTVYFGNANYQTWIKAPASGMGVGSAGYSESLQFLNGGTSVRRSSQTHRTFDMSWSGSMNSGVVDSDLHVIKDFYDDLVSYYSVAVAQNGHMIKYYELPGLTPNYPFEEDTFNLAAPPAGSGLPSEVSLVLSFQGIRQAGFPQARRRGRIYIGPLDTSGMDDQRPLATFVTNLANAGATFKSNIQAITGGQHNWAIWSSVDQECVDVANGWVDNAWDTQRRRGLRATSRTTFT